jgi:hypothetical protein
MNTEENKMSKSFQIFFGVAACALGLTSLVVLSLAENGDARHKGKSGIMPTASLASLPEMKSKRKCWPRQPCNLSTAPKEQSLTSQ